MSSRMLSLAAALTAAGLLAGCAAAPYGGGYNDHSYRYPYGGYGYYGAALSAFPLDHRHRDFGHRHRGFDHHHRHDRHDRWRKHHGDRHERERDHDRDHDRDRDRRRSERDRDGDRDGREDHRHQDLEREPSGDRQVREIPAERTSPERRLREATPEHLRVTEPERRAAGSGQQVLGEGRQ